MFRIRRIFDDTLPINKAAIAQVQEILRSQFIGVPEAEIARLPEQLRNPLKYLFRSILIVADDEAGHTKGFALLLHEPNLHFCYLDYLSAEKGLTGRGIGSALYERVREEALALGAIGIFFESLPDDPSLCRDPQILRQNVARLRFYERYGARPVANTAYETPLHPGGDCPPYLVYDNLGRGTALGREQAQAIVRAILERRYGHRCPPGYIDKVVESFRDDPVRLRPPKYVREEPRLPAPAARTLGRTIALVVNDQQAIHHVHERGLTNMSSEGLRRNR